MFLDGLDEMDRKILSLLIENGRMSYSDLGEAVSLSRVAVRARVQALEERGIIEGYTTILNPQKISGAISCYFDIETEPSTFAIVSERLCTEPIVTQLYQISGSCRLHVHAVAASQAELEHLLCSVLGTLPGIRKLEQNVILSRLKDVKGLRL